MLNAFNAPQAAARARVDWSVDLGKTLYGKPALTEDEVVLGSFDDMRCQVHRIDKNTGETLSTVNVTHQGTLEGQLDGAPIFRAVDGSLAGTDPATGERRWIYTPNGYPGALAISEETMVVGGRNSLTWIKPEDETIDLAYNLPVRNATGISLTPEGGVLAQTQDGKLYNISPVGTLTWSARVEAGGPQHQPVLGPDGVVYTVGFGGTLTALEPSGGTRWQHKSGQPYVNTPAPGENGEVVASTFKGQVSSIDVKTGAVRWSRDTGKPVTKTFVHEDGTVFVHHGDGLQAREGESGQVVQELALPKGELNQAPDGSLVLTTLQGRVQRIVLE